MMRAAVYRGPGDVRVEQIPVPRIEPGELRIRVHACGVCGTDLKKIAYGLAEPPRVFGHETAGVVESVGSGVSGWRPGDRIAVFHHVPCFTCHFCVRRDFAQCPTYKQTGVTAGFEPAGGGFAEYVRVMPWIVERGAVRIPDTVTFEEATFVEPVCTGLKAMERGGVAAGETVAVFGQGQIGLILTRLAVARGARVLASDPIAHRRGMADASGAEALDPTGVADAIRERTGGRGADLAIVAVAHNAVVADAFRAVRPGGAVLLFAQTQLGDPLTVDAGDVCMLEKRLIGSYSSDATLQDAAAEAVFTRSVAVADLVTHRFPLDRIADALMMASTPREGLLKAMVLP